MCVCAKCVMCVCMCVCVRCRLTGGEGKREKERKSWEGRGAVFVVGLLARDLDNTDDDSCYERGGAGGDMEAGRISAIGLGIMC